MKKWLHSILLLTAAMLSFHAVAEDMPEDTVYFYTSWEQMLDQEPEAMLTRPILDAFTPFEIYIETADQRYNRLIDENYIAATLGDSIWLINSTYLKRDFKGDAKKLSGFVPVFFNEKVAYALFHGPLGVKDILFGSAYGDEYDTGMEYYYIDFVNRKVIRITPTGLSGLLEDYHDLQMRYEGMKDYKKSHIIEDYFLKYIDRASQDFMHPYILDLMGNFNIE